MAVGHHVDVACSDEVWRHFKARCAVDGVQVRERLGELVATHMGMSSSSSPTPIPGQQELEERPGSRKAGRAPAKRKTATRRSTKAAAAAPARRRKA